MAIAAALAIVLAAVPCAAAGPQIKLVQERMRSADTLDIKVVLSSKVPIGAYTLQLSFDPAALELIGISGGAREFARPPFFNPAAFATGSVRFSALQPTRMDGPLGLCHVATLNFRRRGTRGHTRITVQPVTLADPLGTVYRPHSRSRTVRLYRN